MSGTETVLQSIKDLSNTNLDTLVKTTSFKDELEEAIRGHVHIELQSWFFYRKLSNDCCRSNVALHGFGTYVSRRTSLLPLAFHMSEDDRLAHICDHVKPLEAVRRRVPGRRQLARVVPRAARRAVQADGHRAAHRRLARQPRRPGAAGARGGQGGEEAARGSAAAVSDGEQVRRQRGRGRDPGALFAQGDAARQGHGRPAAAVRAGEQAGRPRVVPPGPGAEDERRRGAVGRTE